MTFVGTARHAQYSLGGPAWCRCSHHGSKCTSRVHALHHAFLVLLPYYGSCRSKSGPNVQSSTGCLLKGVCRINLAPFFELKSLPRAPSTQQRARDALDILNSGAANTQLLAKIKHRKEPSFTPGIGGVASKQVRSGASERSIDRSYQIHPFRAPCLPTGKIRK